MQMQLHEHKMMPFIYSCCLCGEVFHSTEVPSDLGAEVCPSCAEWHEKEMNICPTCGEPCGIEDELCKECLDRAVCYAEMPAPRDAQ